MNFIKQKLKKFAEKMGYSVKKIQPETLDYTEASKLLEVEYGHLQSKKIGKSIDKDGNPLPWFTYPAIEYFKQLDLSGKTMLEWGSGNSSLFFSKKVKKIYTVEHNKEWYEAVKGYKIKNQELMYADEDYVEKPSEFNISYDIILIDGIKRETCAKQALNLINKGGLIVLDNSDRHPMIAENFRDKGFIEVDFHGLGPINDYSWTTSIFLDRQINLKPLTVQPTIPIGGGY